MASRRDPSPASSALVTTRFSGVGSTKTCCTQLFVWPLPSQTVHVTGVVPIEKLLGASFTILVAEQFPLTSGTPSRTPPTDDCPGAVCTVTFGGQTIIGTASGPLCITSSISRGSSARLHTATSPMLPLKK